MGKLSHIRGVLCCALLSLRCAFLADPIYARPRPARSQTRLRGRLQPFPPCARHAGRTMSRRAKALPAKTSIAKSAAKGTASTFTRMTPASTATPPVFAGRKKTRTRSTDGTDRPTSTRQERRPRPDANSPRLQTPEASTASAASAVGGAAKNDAPACGRVRLTLMRTRCTRGHGPGQCRGGIGGQENSGGGIIRRVRHTVRSPGRAPRA